MDRLSRVKIPWLPEALDTYFTNLDNIAEGSGKELDGYISATSKTSRPLPDDVLGFVDIIVYRRLEQLTLGGITGRR